MVIVCMQTVKSGGLCCHSRCFKQQPCIWHNLLSQTLLSSAGMLALYDGYVDQHESAAAYEEAGVVTPFCAEAVVSCLGQERNLDLLCACVKYI
jgi:hypothetical protein